MTTMGSHYQTSMFGALRGDDAGVHRGGTEALPLVKTAGPLVRLERGQHDTLHPGLPRE